MTLCREILAHLLMICADTALGGDEANSIVFLHSAGPMSKGFRLMTVQFFLLVMRTLITVRTVKLNTHYLTMALSKGSWNYWLKWFTSFAGWMSMGVVTNSGLK